MTNSTASERKLCSALLPIALVMALVACSSNATKHARTDSKTERSSSTAAANEVFRGIDLNCVMDHIQNPPEAFHYSYHKQSSNPVEEQADITPQTIDGSFKNSDVGLPETMTGGLSGEFVVGPGTAVILGSQPLGDELVVYTENELVLVSFVGSPDIFAFRTAVDGVGAVAERLIANYNDHHEFVGRDSLYSFNGVQVETTDTHVWINWIRRQDQNRIRRGYIIFDEENAQVAWVVPLADDGTEAPAQALETSYAEDLPDGTPSPYTRREWPFTAAGFFQRTDQLTWADLPNGWDTYFFSWGDRALAAAFPLLLVGDNDGNVFQLNTADTQDGAAYASYARFGRRFIGDGRARNVLRKVFPFARQENGAAYDLTVTTTAYDSLGQTTGTAVVSTFDLAAADKDAILYVKPRVRGRLADVQVGTAGSTTGQGWRVFGYDWEIIAAGKRGA